MRFKLSLLASLILLMPQMVYSQIALREVNLENVGQIKIQKYLQNQNAEDIYFEDIAPTLLPDADVTGYFVQKKNYFVNDSLSIVWDQYIHTRPADAWNCSMIDFGFLYSKSGNTLYYAKDDGEDLKAGQIIFLNLRFLFGLFNLAMAFEVTSVDEENKIIEFSYIHGNHSEGKQHLQFDETANGSTRILHESYYKSSSRFRDLVMYPIFHTRITDNFHRNMLRNIEAAKSK